MEALYSSEMLVFSYQNSLCHNCEDNSMNSHICNNLRSYKLLLCQWLILELWITDFYKTIPDVTIVD